MDKKLENEVSDKKDHPLNFKLRKDVFDNIKKWAIKEGLTVSGVIKPWIMKAYHERLRKEEESKP